MLAPNPTIGLREQLARGAATRLSSEPATREGAEAGISLAYETVGLEPPATVVHCDGPLQLARALMRAPCGKRMGASLRKGIFEDRLSEALAAAKACWREVLDTDAILADPVGLEFDRLGAQEKASIALNVAAARIITRASMRRWPRLRNQILGRSRTPPPADFTDIGIGPSQLLIVGIFECFQEAMRWDEQVSGLRGLRLIARNSGWIVPFEHVCFVSDRPTRVSADDQGRLHSADHHPAVACRDGWQMWAWKGVEVPSWMIVRPDLVTIEAIDAEHDPVLRRCMIDIMTPERFIATGRATRIAADDAGVLWRARWTYRAVTLGSWTAVEVMDATPNRNGERRRYVLPVPGHVNSPCEAVAWTYGLTAEQYGKLDLRT
jgi:hypothetical protein